MRRLAREAGSVEQPKFDAVKYQVTGVRHNSITIDRCEGHRLPKQPYMWAVRDQFGYVLNKNGDWESEPQPSSRDDAFYDACRFDTYEEAEKAAVAYVVAKGWPLRLSTKNTVADLPLEVKMVIVAAHSAHRNVDSPVDKRSADSAMAALGYALARYDAKFSEERFGNLVKALLEDLPDVDGTEDF